MRKLVAFNDDERIEFTNVRQAANELNLHERNIYSVIAGDRKTSGGYKFEWEDGILNTQYDANQGDHNQEIDRQIQESANSLSWFMRVPNQVTTLEEALKFCEADLTKWEVEKWTSNYWSGFTQVKIFFKPKSKNLEELYNDVLNEVKSWKPTIVNKVKGHKKATILCADFHLGAEVYNLIRTPNYDINIVQNYLNSVAEYVNEKNYDDVTLCFLGDYFESLSGLNHEDSFKYMGKDMWGSNLLITAHKIMLNFLSSINNLSALNVVTGNHDRFAANKRQENTGEAGKILSYMIGVSMPSIAVDYNDLLLSKNIDGINYILTHGDKPISNKDASKIILDYGEIGVYNLLCKGHLHTAKLKNHLKSTLHKFEEFDMIGVDDLNYRDITIPSIFTGNYYSESLGFSGNSSFVISENNGKGKPNLSFINL